MGRIEFLCLLPRGLLHGLGNNKNMCGVCRWSLFCYTWSFQLELLLCLRHGPIHGGYWFNRLYELCGWNLWRDDRALCLRQLRIGHFLNKLGIDCFECVFELRRWQVHCFWSDFMHQLRCGHLPKRDGRDKLYQLLHRHLLLNRGCIKF